MHYFLVFLFLIFPKISISQTTEIKEISKANYVSVIMYHRFGDSRYPSTNITKEQFEKHIKEITKPKYNVIDIKKALEAIKEEELTKDRSIVITIDDAYSSVFDYAWPILKKHNLPFTLFVSNNLYILFPLLGCYWIGAYPPKVGRKVGSVDEVSQACRSGASIAS